MLGKIRRLEDEKNKRYWGHRGEPDLRECWSEIGTVFGSVIVVTMIVSGG